MRSITAVIATLSLLAVSATDLAAQRGMGQNTGVARQMLPPEQLVTFSGTLADIVTGPCELTTGHAVIGTHIFLDTPEGERLNVHLGAAYAVSGSVSGLQVGQPVTVQAFRTSLMPERHYVARSITAGQNVITLRDEWLRPFWASSAAVLSGVGGLPSQSIGLNLLRAQGRGAMRAPMPFRAPGLATGYRSVLPATAVAPRPAWGRTRPGMPRGRAAIRR